MNSPRAERVAVVLVGLLLALGAGVAAADSSPVTMRSVPDGDSDVHWGFAEATINAPLPEVQRILEDYAHYTDFMPYFSVSRVLAKRGAKAMIYIEARLLKDTLRLWAELKTNARRQADNSVLLEGSLMKGNLKRMDARWVLAPVSDSVTRVSLQLRVEPSLPLFPSSILSERNMKASGKALKALRKRIEGADIAPAPTTVALAPAAAGSS